MTLTWFQAHNVRALRDTEFAPGADVNVLVGANGSGKTSVLEALYLLGTGRSFVTTMLESVIRYGERSLRVVARMEEAGRETVVGVERRTGAAPEIHLDGARVDGFARLAERVPVQVIYPQSNELIIGGPMHRRRFLDWGVFHVEHEFMASWREYQRALSQRNAALRSAQKPAELHPWDRILSRAGEELARYREAYLAQLVPHVDAAADELFREETVELQLNRGWGNDVSLGGALARSFERDRRVAATSVGPHRAELKIRFAGRDARLSASRGQQKVLVYALKLAQMAHLWQLRRQETLLLLDDLPSELDQHSRKRVFNGLRSLKGQIFVTAIEHGQLESLMLHRPAKLFHVEQGSVKELV